MTSPHGTFPNIGYAQMDFLPVLTGDFSDRHLGNYVLPFPAAGNEARRRNVVLRILPTAQAIELLKAADPDTNAILHVTC